MAKTSNQKIHHQKLKTYPKNEKPTIKQLVTLKFAFHQSPTYTPPLTK